MNVDFLKKEGVTHVVSTAKGLDTQFGPRYAVSFIIVIMIIDFGGLIMANFIHFIECS